MCAPREKGDWRDRDGAAATTTVSFGAPEGSKARKDETTCNGVSVHVVLDLQSAGCIVIGCEVMSLLSKLPTALINSLFFNLLSRFSQLLANT